MMNTVDLQGKPAQLSARRGLLIYLSIVLILSAVIEGYVISYPQRDGLIAALMLVPALASLIARLLLKEGFADVSFRLGGFRGIRYIGFAFVFPVVVGLITYGTAWATGLVAFVPPSTVNSDVFVSFLVGFAVSFVLVSGEEIGWRGYMLTRLIEAGVPRPVLMSGLIWGVWHLPLVLVGVYASGPSPALSALLLLIGITAFSYVIARFRLETGSVWPAVALHAAWNSIIQGPFDGASAGATAALWVGESGMLTALTLVAAAILLSRGTWAISRNRSGAR